jgi:hypothetical protein
MRVETADEYDMAWRELRRRQRLYGLSIVLCVGTPFVGLLVRLVQYWWGQNPIIFALQVVLTGVMVIAVFLLLISTIRLHWWRLRWTPSVGQKWALDKLGWRPARPLLQVWRGRSG